MRRSAVGQKLQLMAAILAYQEKDPVIIIINLPVDLAHTPNVSKFS